MGPSRDNKRIYTGILNEFCTESVWILYRIDTGPVRRPWNRSNVINIGPVPGQSWHIVTFLQGTNVNLPWLTTNGSESTIWLNPTHFWPIMTCVSVDMCGAQVIFVLFWWWCAGSGSAVTGAKIQCVLKRNGGVTYTRVLMFKTFY